MLVQLSLPLHAQLSAGNTKPFGKIWTLLRYPGGISDTFTSQLFVPNWFSGMFYGKYLDCCFVSPCGSFSEPNVFCGPFGLKPGCHLVCLEGEGEVLPKPVCTALFGPWKISKTLTLRKILYSFPPWYISENGLLGVFAVSDEIQLFQMTITNGLTFYSHMISGGIQSLDSQSSVSLLH